MDDPILYGMEEPFCNRVSFPLSDSAFYGMSDHSLKRFISAEECGGSARGDRVCFWLNRETKEILPGTTGAAGGFMGFSSWRTIYAGKGDSFIMREKLSWIGQARSNYNDEELLENAELFFDGDDMPFTRETILEAEAVDEYEINGERVTPEEYRACSEKYIEVGILE